MKIEHAKDGRSARMVETCSTDVPEDAQIRPLRDQIIVEPLAVELSKILIVKEDIKPLRGIVRAAGPGHYPWLYDHPEKHKRTKMWESKVFMKTSVKVGDVVELGGYERRGYAFPTIYWGDKTMLICREADVSGIVR